MKIDIQQYQILQEIYDYYNNCFFDNKLPEIVFTIDYRKSQTVLGYFHSEKLKQGDKRISIISLNPDRFDRENIEIIATLVHEMVHVWQHYCSPKKARGGYHDKIWAGKMESIGLFPSNDGTETGKKTGRVMHHYIVRHGLFEQKTDAFIRMHNNIFLFSGIVQMKEKIASNRNKVKYTCLCGNNIWGKPNLDIKCNECESNFTSYE